MIDTTKRDELIFGRPLIKEDYIGGVVTFGMGKYSIGKPVSVSVAKQFVNDRYVEMDERQNSSPTTKDLIKFCEKYPQVMLYGYVVSPERNDCRVTFTGMICETDITKELMFDFENFCQSYNPDRLIISNDMLDVYWD